MRSAVHQCKLGITGRINTQFLRMCSNLFGAMFVTVGASQGPGVAGNGFSSKNDSQFRGRHSNPCPGNPFRFFSNTASRVTFLVTMPSASRQTPCANGRTWRAGGPRCLAGAPLCDASGPRTFGSPQPTPPRNTIRTPPVPAPSAPHLESSGRMIRRASQNLPSRLDDSVPAHSGFYCALLLCLTALHR